MRGLLAGVGLVVGCVAGSVIPADAVARQHGQMQTGQTQTGPTQPGRIIEAQDGDTVIVHDKTRVRMLKRTPGRVRIAVNQERRFVVVMLDKGANGSADWVWRFQIDQPYPLEAPWEGAADVDEYFEPSRPSGGIGVVTPQGVIQFLSTPPQQDDPHAVANALAVVRTHGSTGKAVSGTFAALEPFWLDGREDDYPGTPTFRFGVSMTGGPPPPPRNSNTPLERQP